jgi:hypothetical protein
MVLTMKQKLVNDGNKKQLLCESKYHFLFLCVCEEIDVFCVCVL